MKGKNPMNLDIIPTNLLESAINPLSLKLTPFYFRPRQLTWDTTKSVAGLIYE